MICKTTGRLKWASVQTQTTCPHHLCTSGISQRGNFLDSRHHFCSHYNSGGFQTSPQNVGNICLMCNSERIQVQVDLNLKTMYSHSIMRERSPPQTQTQTYMSCLLKHCYIQFLVSEFEWKDVGLILDLQSLSSNSLTYPEKGARPLHFNKTLAKNFLNQISP